MPAFYPFLPSSRSSHVNTKAQPFADRLSPLHLFHPSSDEGTWYWNGSWTRHHSSGCVSVGGLLRTPDADKLLFRSLAYILDLGPSLILFSKRSVLIAAREPIPLRPETDPLRVCPFDLYSSPWPWRLAALAGCSAVNGNSEKGEECLNRQREGEFEKREGRCPLSCESDVFVSSEKEGCVLRPTSYNALNA